MIFALPDRSWPDIERDGRRPPPMQTTAPGSSSGGGRGDRRRHRWTDRRALRLRAHRGRPWPLPPQPARPEAALALIGIVLRLSHCPPTSTGAARRITRLRLPPRRPALRPRHIQIQPPTMGRSPIPPGCTRPPGASGCCSVEACPAPAVWAAVVVMVWAVLLVVVVVVLAVAVVLRLTMAVRATRRPAVVGGGGAVADHQQQ